MSEIFRDRTEGALARRQDLLRKRRDEFVTMPHTIRRVVVARAARAAAATAAIVCGSAMIAVAMSPKLAKLIASGLPGINPAVISTGVAAAWVLALVAFAISRGRAEHRFAVAMSTYVLPGDDLDHDIERLSHERPDRVARAMAHRHEVRSAALPVMAAAFIVPATLVYIAHALHVGGWPSTAEYEANLALVGKPLLASALTGLVAGILMTRAWARRDGVLVPAALVSLLAGGGAVAMLLDRELVTTWVFTTTSVIAGAIAVIIWNLRRERAALEIEDPAAGSELFTLRGFIQSIRTVAVATARRLPRRPAMIAATVLSLSLVCGGAFMLEQNRAQNRAAAAAALKARSPTVTPPTSTALGVPGRSSLAKWEMTQDGRIRYEIRFVDGKPITLDGLHAFQVLPKGWRARVAISVIDGSMPGAVEVTPFPDNTDAVVPLHLGDGATEHRFSFSACDEDVNLGLQLTPDAKWPTNGEVVVSFLVEPTLEIATCAAPTL